MSEFVFCTNLHRLFAFISGGERRKKLEYNFRYPPDEIERPTVAVATLNENDNEEIDEGNPLKNWTAPRERPHRKPRTEIVNSENNNKAHTVH